MPRRYEVRHPRSPVARVVRRVLGVAGTGVVLAIGVVSASMVLAADDDDVEVPPAASAAAAGRKAEQRRQSEPRKPRLSARRREERRRAIDQVRREGYRPVELDDFRAQHDQVLRVLIGEPVGTTPPGLRAFFFVRGDYIGKDSISSTLKLRPGRQLDREITLVYTLYEVGDRECCPQGGDARVHFRWTGEALEPQEQIPPDYQRLPPAFAQ